MAFRCDLGATDRALEILAAAYGKSKQAMVKELVIAAVADEPKVRDLLDVPTWADRKSG